MNRIHFDVIINGGGVVGLTLANLLAELGIQVVVIEQHALQIPQAKIEAEKNLEKNKVNEQAVQSNETSEFDNRTFALSLKSKAILSSIGIWEEIQKSAYHRMFVWEKEGFGEIEFQAKEIEQAHLGYIVEHRVLIQHLWAKTQQSDNITVFLNQSPHNISYEKDDIVLHLAQENILTAQLLVGAEGAKSWVRHQAGIETDEKPYQQSAVVAIIETEKNHEHTAWQCFLKEGPIAFLPLSQENISSMIWTRSNENAKRTLNMSREDLAQEIAEAFEFRLGRVRLCNNINTFPLKRIQAKHYCAQRIALVGDAAHVIHPMAGQGLNLGLEDAECLSTILGAAFKKQVDYGNELLLRKYERERRTRVMQMMHGLEFIKSWFGQKTIGLGLHSFAVQAVNRLPFLKRKFIREASGL